MQRVRAGGILALVVAVPLSSSTALYEIDSLRELNDNVRLLALVLTAVAIMTAVAGAALGWYATRYVLRPLTVVAEVAHDIAAGDFNARLDPAAEPDLARLTTSFNNMVDQLSARMQQDRRFAADVSHELRSPLQTLSAAVSVVVRRREHLDDRTATAVGLIADEITRFQAGAMTVMPSSEGTAVLICDRCGAQENATVATHDHDVVWPLVANAGWTGSLSRPERTGAAVRTRCARDDHARQ